jgi:phage terminase large subunit-like protein
VTVLAEVNNGGDLVSAALHQVLPQIKMQEIRANKGKLLRAEPVGTLYERGIIYHLARGNGRFEQLEDQMVNFTGYEPQKADQEVVEIERLDHDDRLDALVYGMRYLFSEECNPRKIGYIPFKFLNFQ